MLHGGRRETGGLCCHFEILNYPYFIIFSPCACICAAGLCIWSHLFVYICMSTKNRLFSALLLENLLLSVICCLFFKFECLQCGLLRPVSCTDRIIHAFPNKMGRSPAPKYFLPGFNSTPHHLDYLAYLVTL